MNAPPETSNILKIDCPQWLVGADVSLHSEMKLALELLAFNESFMLRWFVDEENVFWFILCLIWLGVLLIFLFDLPTSPLTKLALYFLCVWNRCFLPFLCQIVLIFAWILALPRLLNFPWSKNSFEALLAPRVADLYRKTNLSRYLQCPLSPQKFGIWIL